MPEKRCLICALPGAAKLGAPSGYKVIRCRRCRSVSCLGRTPSTQELYGRDYFRSNYLAHEDDRSAFLDRLLAVLGDGRSRTLVDCGCGAGLALDAAVRAGWVAAGFDVSEAACQFASSRGHAVVRATATAPPFRRHSVQAVLLLDVVAHVPRPAMAIREAAKLLVPGGYLMVKTPHRPGWAYRLAGWLPSRASRSLMHLPHQRHAISRRGLASMMIAAGLDDVAVSPIGEAVPMRHRLRGKLKASMSALAGAALDLLYGSPSNVAIGRLHE